MDTSCEIALRWTPQNCTNDKSTLVQVMAWCSQATSHYLSQCWPKSISPHGVTNWPEWEESCIEHTRDIYFWASAPKILFPTLQHIYHRNSASATVGPVRLLYKCLQPKLIIYISYCYIHIHVTKIFNAENEGKLGRKLKTRVDMDSSVGQKVS